MHRLGLTYFPPAIGDILLFQRSWFVQKLDHAAMKMSLFPRKWTGEDSGEKLAFFFFQKV